MGVAELHNTIIVESLGQVGRNEGVTMHLKRLEDHEMAIEHQGPYN